MMQADFRIALAIGDPNGIGPEIAVKAALTAPEGVRCILVGDEEVLADSLRRYADGRKVQMQPEPSLASGTFKPGHLSADAGAATIAYLKKAVSMVLAGEADAVACCPCSETAINMAGISFAGFQPMLAQLTGVPRDSVFMMLVTEDLMISHVTLHEGLRSALDRITQDLVMSAVHATHQALMSLGIQKPKLALLGINPHAGEDGLFGDEDERITKPAAIRLVQEGLDVTGPHPADLVLGQRAHSAYIAMFHDQGHIPIKLLSPLQATSLTIGAPLLFASVAHGCAHDIAGQGQANPRAMENAIAVLSQRVRRRA